MNHPKGASPSDLLPSLRAWYYQPRSNRSDVRSSVHFWLQLIQGIDTIPMVTQKMQFNIELAFCRKQVYNDPLCFFLHCLKCQVLHLWQGMWQTTHLPVPTEVFCTPEFHYYGVELPKSKKPETMRRRPSSHYHVNCLCLGERRSEGLQNTSGAPGNGVL